MTYFSYTEINNSLYQIATIRANNPIINNFTPNLTKIDLILSKRELKDIANAIKAIIYIMNQWKRICLFLIDDIINAIILLTKYVSIHAMAPPTKPKSGISIRFNPIFTATAIKVIVKITCVSFKKRTFTKKKYIA